MKNKNICKLIPPSLADRLSVSGFVLESNPEVMRTPTRMNEHSMILVKNGSGRFCFDDAKFPFSPGHLVFGLKGEVFCVECEQACEYLYICFDGARAAELFRRFSITPLSRSFPGFDSLIPLWSESLSRAGELTVDLASESMLLYAFSRLSGSLTSQNILIRQMIEITEERFSDPDLSLSLLAEELGYNPKYLSHQFKRSVGKGYSEYLQTVRIKFAVSLFDHGLDSVKNVALLSGFSDPFYFSSVFKKHLGTAPREYLQTRKA